MYISGLAPGRRRSSPKGPPWATEEQSLTNSPLETNFFKYSGTAMQNREIQGGPEVPGRHSNLTCERFRVSGATVANICRPLQSVERVRLQGSKPTMPFKIQAQAARHQPKQPRITHASISPAQDDSCLQQPRLDGAASGQLIFFRGHSSAQSGAGLGAAAPAPL